MTLDADEVRPSLRARLSPCRMFLGPRQGRMFLGPRQAIQSMRGHLAASPHHLTERR